MKKVVTGEGPLRPKYVFVGEAPGKDEEKRGRPFVGRAGQLLRSSLMSQGIDPADCYFTNVVKIRPSMPGGANRKPNRREIATYLPRLQRELRLRPCVPVVLLGDTSVSAVLGRRFRIARHHGLAAVREGRGYLISYQPSAAARFPKIRRAFTADLGFLAAKFAPREMYTIGHSTRTVPTFIRVLKRYGIKRLVDIRHYPRSRHNPQFNRVGLRRALSKHDIDYKWLVALGGFQKGGYEAYLATPEFAAGLNALAALASKERTAIMCAEIVWFRCHRRYVSDALAVLGFTIKHILDEKRLEIHYGYTGPAGIKCD